MATGDDLKSFSEPINKLLVPFATSVGNTLNDVWELVFGGFGNYVEKKRTIRYKALEEFKSSLENKVAQIPEENLCEPALSIIGPTLEASKYYYEEPELREMFVSLISSTMDKQKVSSVHPIFVNIIKGMTSLDAQNLTYIDMEAPIAEYYILRENDEFDTFLQNVFLENPNETDILLQSQSISILQQLGLVKITFDEEVGDSTRYAPFRETPSFNALCAKTRENPSMGKATLNFGVISLTPLGIRFKEICLS